MNPLSNILKRKREEILGRCIQEFQKQSKPLDGIKLLLNEALEAISADIESQKWNESDAFIEDMMTKITQGEISLSQGIKTLTALRKVISGTFLHLSDDGRGVRMIVSLDKWVDEITERIARDLQNILLEAKNKIDNGDRQIEELKQNSFKFTSKRSRGWVDVAGTRMCLLDIPGGWLNIGTSIILFAGEDTSRRVLFEAGFSETFCKTALKNGTLRNTAEGFSDAVATYSEAGFGDFVIREMRFEEGYARITCRDTFEGWAFLYNRRFSESPVCYYSTGVLLSFMQKISQRGDLISAETKCIAKGGEECEFVIGTKKELQQRGIRPPKWGMTIKEKAEYLENLLEEKKRVEQEIIKKNVELLALNRISATVGQSLNLEEILNLAISELLKIVGDKGVGIYLLDREKKELIFTAQKGFSNDFYKSVSRIRIGEGMTGSVAGQQMPMACDDYSKYPQALGPVVQNEKIKSLLSVPLMSKDKVVGVLNIASRTPYHFSSDEINLMTLIGNQIGVAIENAQLHEEIKESEKKYKTLVEDINDGYFVSQNGRIIFTNQAFLTMHGYSQEEIMDRDLKEILPVECFQQIEKVYRGRIEWAHISGHTEFLRMAKDGTKLPTELKVNLIEFAGKPAIVGICRDISERKKMEQKILENERLASIGQLVTAIAHEIRNPLSAIKMNIQILSKNLNLQGFNKRRLEIATDEIKRLDRIVEDVLDFGRPADMRMVPYSINNVIEKCIDLLSDRIRERSVRITRRMPATVEDIPMDCEKMEQAVLNLILNSIDAMASGGILEISTGNVELLDRKMLKMEIKDTGIGISSEHMARIFDPFFTTKTKGVGLGLSNVKKIIEAHGGMIEVNSRVNDGTSFTILLPRSEA